jgi:hypothetical protein
VRLKIETLEGRDLMSAGSIPAPPETREWRGLRVLRHA